MVELENNEFFINLEKRLLGIEGEIKSGLQDVKFKVDKVGDKLDYNIRSVLQLNDVIKEDITALRGRVTKIEDTNPVELSHRVEVMEDSLTWVRRALFGAVFSLIVSIMIILISNMK